MKAGGSPAKMLKSCSAAAQVLLLASVGAKCLHRLGVTGKVHGGEIHPGLVGWSPHFFPRDSLPWKGRLWVYSGHRLHYPYGLLQDVGQKFKLSINHRHCLQSTGLWDFTELRPSSQFMETGVSWLTLQGRHECTSRDNLDLNLWRDCEQLHCVRPAVHLPYILLWQWLRLVPITNL